MKNSEIVDNLYTSVRDQFATIGEVPDEHFIPVLCKDCKHNEDCFRMADVDGDGEYRANFFCADGERA